MNSPHSLMDRLQPLLEAACEDSLSPEAALRLEAELRDSAEARWLYLTYMELHGSLYWDVAGGLAAPLPEARVAQSEPVSPAARRRSTAAIAATALALVLTVVVVPLWWGSRHVGPATLVDKDAHSAAPQPVVDDINTAAPHRDPGAPVIAVHPATEPASSDHAPSTPVTPGLPGVAAADTPTSVDSPTAASAKLIPVSLINSELAAGWRLAGIQPSARAEDGEWLRRLTLDIAGRIPSVAELEQFLADRTTDRRAHAVDRLLDSPEYARHLTTEWANLLVGRSCGPEVDLPALKKFLRTGFAANRPWNELVFDLVSAEGNGHDNGAANFLLAHLNNQALPATALTARLFLGQQLQCVQCHKHPFNDVEQTAFWEFNSFFQQTEAVTHRQRDPKSGREMTVGMSLVNRPAGGPTYYETRNGLMKVAFPRYGGREVDPAPEVNRRRELARLMTSGDQPQLAAAFVNRVWEQFFGHSFTRGVDDLGPHNPPSHPQLLAGLSREFIQSGYDVKQLIRWICLSDAYQLSSRPNDTNRGDDPELGDLPLFSRIYVRSMTAEQLYDSLLTATRATQAAGDWTRAESQRQAWLEQFIVTFGTEENDEANTFDGTVSQALAMMNGDVVQTALAAAPGTVLGDVVRDRSTEAEKIRRLCQATLSRTPTQREMTSMKRLLARASRPGPRSTEAYEDLFWALLNSNEFALLH